MPGAGQHTSSLTEKSVAVDEKLIDPIVGRSLIQELLAFREGEKELLTVLILILKNLLILADHLRAVIGESLRLIAA